MAKLKADYSQPATASASSYQVVSPKKPPQRRVALTKKQRDYAAKEGFFSRFKRHRRERSEDTKKLKVELYRNEQRRRDQDIKHRVELEQLKQRHAYQLDKAKEQTSYNEMRRQAIERQRLKATRGKRLRQWTSKELGKLTKTNKAQKRTESTHTSTPSAEDDFGQNVDEFGSARDDLPY